MIFVEARTLGSTINDNDLVHVQEDDQIVRLTRNCREDSFDNTQTANVYANSDFCSNR